MSRRQRRTARIDPLRGESAVTSASDPFDERPPATLRAQLTVLGASFTVETSNKAALQLACDAFGGLPRQRLDTEPRSFRVHLAMSRHRSAFPRRGQPPRPVLTSGNGLLCATIDAGNFAIIDPAHARALVSLSRAMLQRKYHARYELIELAVLTLASRGQALVPLHAACVGTHGSGLLLMGPSGAGKSTLSLHALAAGMQLLSEDSAFVAADSLLVTGTPNYLHVRTSGLRALPDGPLRRQVRRSPTIRRRSGVRKYEVDLRAVTGRIATRPLRIVATVFLSPKPAGRQPPMRRLRRDAFLARLRREQPYAAGLDNWRSFERRIVAVPAFELRRMRDPDAAVEELRAVLAAAESRS